MNRATSFAVNPAWGLLMTDLGVSPQAVLRRAGLPVDLVSGQTAWLTPNDYFSLWKALEDEADDPDLPIRIARAFSMEVFDPPIFAAACSRNLNVAARRIATYKKLIGPLRITVTESTRDTVVRYEWPPHVHPPASLAMTELLFWVALVRLATREDIRPLWVTSFEAPRHDDAYRDYLGVPVTRDSFQAIAFSAGNAAQSFLTANEPMWNYFEPQLRTRLSELEQGAAMADRVRGALLEMLPAGHASIEAAAEKLAVTPRTLQRRLADETTTFQMLRAEVRQVLATHYLSTSTMTAAEISFLLGYEDSNSFYRAFHGWTGLTPEVARAAAR